MENENVGDLRSWPKQKIGLLDHGTSLSDHGLLGASDMLYELHGRPEEK